MCVGSPRPLADSGRWQRFRAWRRTRPFWGGTFLLVAGVLTGYLPSAYGSFVAIATGSFTGPAVLFGVAFVVCGVVALGAPSLSQLFGLLGMFLSALAVLGALGGFLVGSLLGGFGGLLTFAWTRPSGATTDERS